MAFRKKPACLVLCLGVLALGLGCDQSPAGPGADASVAQAPDGKQGVVAPKAQANRIVGRVTMADGSPITTAGATYSIGISGVSSAGERVGFSAAVKADGTYAQKVPDGSYQIRYGKITVPYRDLKFTFDLEPQGDQYANDRDASEPITQDFVWKTTGPKRLFSDGKHDPNNHTHWYGMQLGMRFSGYREDLKAPAVQPPAKTKLTFTLTPMTGAKAIDGSELKPVVIEREYDPGKTTPNDDLNDFMPGDYDLTGTATLPDGTTKTIVFQGNGNYPNYVKVGKATLGADGIIGGMWKQPFGWGFE